MTGEAISFYPSALRKSSVQAWLPAPNDDKSLSFDYTPTFAEASEGRRWKRKHSLRLQPRPEDPAPIYSPNSCGAGGAKYYHWQGQWSGGKKKGFLEFAPHGTGPWAKQKKKSFPRW